MADRPLSTAARTALERISRVVEANPGADARTIRVRAGVSRERGDAVLARLLADGFIERRRLNADWSYTSVRPYRANAEGPRLGFGSSHSTREGGEG
jgi:DNA-binding MarR family transcriptional regulator